MVSTTHKSKGNNTVIGTQNSDLLTTGTFLNVSLIHKASYSLTCGAECYSKLL